MRNWYFACAMATCDYHPGQGMLNCAAETVLEAKRGVVEQAEDGDFDLEDEFLVIKLQGEGAETREQIRKRMDEYILKYCKEDQSGWKRSFTDSMMETIDEELIQCQKDNCEE